MNSFKALSFLLLATLVRSHSFLTLPDAYNRQFRTRFCREPECSWACPVEYNTGMSNSVDKPAAVWSRGDTVDIHWARNNHHGGFFRLAIVPVGVMLDRDWHTKLSILHGCWESGAIQCTGNECGTDREGVMFSRMITVPSVFPDGSYVLGLVWYGGTRRNGDGFQDFFSCSHIRIEGGPLGGSHKATFDAGEGEGVKDGECFTSVDEIGVCGSKGCKNVPPFYGLPKVVRTGSESVITPNLVEEVLDMPAPGVENGRENEPADEKYGGICAGNTCCAKSCGSCGGPGCARRAGGSEECCGRSIRSSGRRCGEVDAPCVIIRGN